MAPPAPLEHRNIRSVLERMLAERLDQAALFDPTSTMTYAALWRAALQLGGGLQALGVERQGVCVIMLNDHTAAP